MMSSAFELRFNQEEREVRSWALVASALVKSLTLSLGKPRPRGDWINLANDSASLSANCNCWAAASFWNFDTPMTTAHSFRSCACAVNDTNSKMTASLGIKHKYNPLESLSAHS